MVRAECFVEEGRARGFHLYSGVPCSYLTPFINYVIGSPGVRYVGAANEGDAVAVAAGSELGGVRSVVMCQNSGLGNAVNPLTSLTAIFRIPILLLVTHRGRPGGPLDEPQHLLMGQITMQMLDLMEIPWEVFPANDEEIPEALGRADRHLQEVGTPYAMVMKKGSVVGGTASPAPVMKTPTPYSVNNPSDTAVTRGEVLRAIQAAVGPGDVLLATTGHTGRELYACDDRANQLYMVGSMGCVSSLGLGLALARPKMRVIAIDGDGAALMRLGAFATIGHERPTNFLHVLLDNGVHESTGGQATVSRSIDFAMIAAACGYERVGHAATPEEVGAWIREPVEGPAFLHVATTQGHMSGLPRPDLSPEAVANRFRAFLNS